MDPPSRILLLVITQLPPSVALNNNRLHQMFSQFGTVKKILIFERGKVNKAFVEYLDIQNASCARAALNFKYLAYGAGRM